MSSCVAPSAKNLADVLDSILCDEAVHSQAPRSEVWYPLGIRTTACKVVSRLCVPTSLGEALGVKHHPQWQGCDLRPLFALLPQITVSPQVPSPVGQHSLWQAAARRSSTCPDPSPCNTHSVHYKCLYYRPYHSLVEGLKAQTAFSVARLPTKARCVPFYLFVSHSVPASAEPG